MLAVHTQVEWHAGREAPGKASAVTAMKSGQAWLVKQESEWRE